MCEFESHRTQFIFLVGVQVSRLHPREYRIRCLTAINNDERIRIISKPEHFRNELKDDGEDGPVP